MNYRRLSMVITSKYWDTNSDHKAWSLVKKLNKKAFKESFPNAEQVDTKSDMYLKTYE